MLKFCSQGEDAAPFFGHECIILYSGDNTFCTKFNIENAVLPEAKVTKLVENNNMKNKCGQNMDFKVI